MQQKQSLREGRTSMSVMEMGRLLGLKKTGSYWLIKKNYFKTIIAGDKMRVMIDSFEEWYTNQKHYKKVQDIGGVDNGIDC